MADKEIILKVLIFLKSEGDKQKNGIDIKNYFRQLNDLDEKDWERIRDRLVINEYASLAQGDQWKLSITWHPDGGVDLLRKPKWAINKNGNLRNFYKSWNLLVKHSVAITISVIGGLILFFFTDIVIKPKLFNKDQQTPTNQIKNTNSSRRLNPDISTKAIEKDSLKYEQSTTQ